MSRPVWCAWALLVISVWSATVVASTSASASEATPVGVASDDHVAGRVLLGTFSCTACHALPNENAWIARPGAPRLEVLAGRLSPAWLQAFLADPHATMPGTTMPEVLQRVPAAERAQAATDLTQYLIAQRLGPWTPTMPDHAAVARGEDLYQHIGCVACHAPMEQPGLGGVPLSHLTDKWTVTTLRDFLRDPLASRPAGRMPSLGLSVREAGDVAEYLLRETRVEASLTVAEYRGRMDDFDEIETAELVRTTPAADFTHAVVGLERLHAVQATGWIQVEQDVDRTFCVTAHGACRLGIDGQWLIGAQSWRSERVDGQASVHLTAGWHTVVMEYAQRGQTQGSVTVAWDGPGGQLQTIPSSQLHSERQPVPRRPDMVPEAGAAQRGQVRYLQLGCARCHDGSSEPGQTSMSAPALLTVQTGRGCLADAPPATVPAYHLDTQQRTALRAAIDHLRTVGAAEPPLQDRLRLGLTAFRCTACHVRDGQGGVPEERAAWFLSQSDDSGDEGRLPPRLDGVGDRLTPHWLRRVLTEDARVRPYVRTRMPHFGATNVGPLADVLIALDRQPQPVPPVGDPPDVLRAAGRSLVGTTGLSCIACHRFNRQPALSMNMLDLTNVPERLNEDWFRRFLRDPNHYHPGTRMPSFWPAGMSLIASALGGDTERQHAALWTYLSDGQRATFPEGLSRTNQEMVVGGQPVVYRGKLWEAGFRAVAMGFPGQVTAAFDAEEIRLALLWRGRFLDVSPHWSHSGMGSIHPLGDQVVVFPHGSACAVLPDAGTPWPTEPGKALGMVFHGYDLDAHLNPTLRYGFGTMMIVDRLTSVDRGGSTVVARQVRLSGDPVDHLHLRLAVGAVTATGPGTWRVNDAVTISVTGRSPGTVRGEPGHQELLVPLDLSAGTDAAATSTLEIQYAW